MCHFDCRTVWQTLQREEEDEEEEQRSQRRGYRVCLRLTQSHTLFSYALSYFEQFIKHSHSVTVLSVSHTVCVSLSISYLTLMLYYNTFKRSLSTVLALNSTLTQLTILLTFSPLSRSHSHSLRTISLSV